MNIENRWYLLLAFAASAVVGATVAARWRRERRHTTRHRDHAADLKSWENEGGNLAPVPAASTAS